MDTEIIKGVLRGAIDEAVQKLRRDDSLAMPFVYIGQNDDSRLVIQWMLPLQFSNEDGVTAALVVERLDHGYRGATILTLEMAYKNARVIRTLSKPWLISSLTEDPKPLAKKDAEEVSEEEEGSPEDSDDQEENEDGSSGEVAKTEEAMLFDTKKYRCGYLRYASGCTKGDQCIFSHDPTAPNKPRTSRVKAAIGYVSSRNSDDIIPKKERPTKVYRCEYFLKESGCTNGDQCTFSHDPAAPIKPKRMKPKVADPRVPPPKPKTPCRHFHGTGCCALGDKCHFLHN